MRASNTNRHGRSFSQFEIDQVWNKGAIDPLYDPYIYRRDRCGALMKRSDYGSILSVFGWEIDHIIAVSRGGSDELYNLQPLLWQNNRSKADSPPDNWYCAIRA